MHIHVTDPINETLHHTLSRFGRLLRNVGSHQGSERTTDDRDQIEPRFDRDKHVIGRGTHPVVPFMAMFSAGEATSFPPNRLIFSGVTLLSQVYVADSSQRRD